MPMILLSILHGAVKTLRRRSTTPPPHCTVRGTVSSSEMTSIVSSILLLRKGWCMKKRIGFVFCVLQCVIISVCVGQISVVGDLSQDREAVPGEKYEGSILLRNDESEPQEAKIYQTDY